MSRYRGNPRAIAPAVEPGRVHRGVRTDIVRFELLVELRIGLFP